MIPRTWVELGELHSICPAAAYQQEAAHFHLRVQDFLSRGQRMKAAATQAHRQFINQRARREMGVE